MVKNNANKHFKQHGCTHPPRFVPVPVSPSGLGEVGGAATTTTNATQGLEINDGGRDEDGTTDISLGEDYDHELVSRLEELQPGQPLEGGKVQGRLRAFPSDLSGHHYKLDLLEIIGLMVVFKASYNWSQSCFSNMLLALKALSILPGPLRQTIPSSYLDAMAMVESFGVQRTSVVVYESCSACGFLFRGEHSRPECNMCPECTHPRKDTISYYYFPVKDTISQSASLPSWIEGVKYPLSRSSTPGVITDVWDGKVGAVRV